MGRWAALVAQKAATPPEVGTDKTAKRGLSSVLAVPPKGGAADLRGLPPEPADCAATPAPMRVCADCAHRTRRKTCAEPVAAGLAPHFGIVFCELLQATQAGRCPAFSMRIG